MKLVPALQWRARAPLDARLVPLLRALRAHATLRGAAAELGVSYRSAWELLGAASRELGAPLVRMARGRGARLAPLAERLLEADAALGRELERLAPRYAVEVPAAGRAAARPLRVAASHDLLLAELCAARDLPLEIAFKGSLESLAALARGEAELAGFHVSAGAGHPEDLGPVERLLDARRHRLVRFAAREQGLIVPRANPRRLRSLADLAAQRLVFVHRQRGSGTRLLFDQMLAQAGLAAGDIRGYGTEEFTHLAVAATIAAGRADAGFGVKAAAKRFGLGFVPLRRERYWFALRARDADHAALAAFLEALRAPALARLARKLGGYDAAGAGELAPVTALAGAA